MKFLVFGDVVGRPGREAITRALPLLREEYAAEAVIVNIENMAHGHGISPETWKEAKVWGADVYTTGDHAWDNKQGLELLQDASLPIIRPANYPPNVPGRGFHVFSAGAYQVAVINLQGQVFFKNHPLNPFLYLNDMLTLPEIANAQIKLIDFHAGATSEVRALGWHADGKISGMWGTHTHVPTADAQILPQGAGYITDVGMNGAYHSIIGMDHAGPMKTFLQQTKTKFTPPEGGPLEVGALFLEIDPPSGKTVKIEAIRRILPAKN